jgi:hypothetical protein
MKKYFICVAFILLFIGVMQISAFANPPFDNIGAEGLYFNSGFRAAQHTNANMGANFSPSNSNWTDIQASSNTSSIVINVPHDATYINFLFWDFGTYNQLSSPNRGWIFDSHIINYYAGGLRVNASTPYIGRFATNTQLGRVIRAQGRHIAVNTNHFRRDGSPSFFEIERLRWVTVRGVPRTVAHNIVFHINWTGEPPPPPPPPGDVSYNDVTQLLSGVTSAMEYSILTTGWSAWIQGTGQPINLASFLCTSRDTHIVVRFRSPQSAQVGITIPALSLAPTQLSIIWHNGDILLGGFRPGFIYALSRDSSFTGNAYIGLIGSSTTSVHTHVRLNNDINPGDTLYVREVSPNPNDFFSAYVRLVAPTAYTPSVAYDRTQHHLVFPSAGPHWIRINSNSDNDWISLNIPSPNTRINLYPFLSAENETRIEIEDWWSYQNPQIIIVPPLEPAPDMWFEWVSGLGLVLWGYEIGHLYEESLASSFNAISQRYFAVTPGESFGVMTPGATLFVRFARDLNSPPSSFIRLTVPPFPHDIETSLVGLKFENGVFSYDAINIYDRFKVNATRQRFVVIRRYDANGNVTTSPPYSVNVVNDGVNLPLSTIASAFRNFTADEQLEILVYRENTMQNQLSRQVIHPLMFAFE